MKTELQTGYIYLFVAKNIILTKIVFPEVCEGFGGIDCSGNHGLIQCIVENNLSQNYELIDKFQYFIKHH